MEKQLETVIEKQDIDALQSLIDEGLDVSEIRLVDVFSLIFKSCNKDEIEKHLNTKFIMILINNGADINYEKESKNEIEIFLDLFDNSSKKMKIMLNCLLFSFWFYDKELIEYFIKMGADVNQELAIFRFNIFSFAQQSYPLEEAYYHNDIDLMRYLIDKGAKIHKDIEVYDTISNLEANKILLEQGVHPNQFVWNHSSTVIKALTDQLVGESRHIEYFIDRDENYINDIITQIVMFIHYGADVNTDCPLNDILTSNFLNSKNKIELFTIFLDHGLDIDCRDSQNNTPLICISDLDKGDVFEINGGENTEKDLFIKTMINNLIKEGANINAKNNLGMTALMKASFNNSEHIVSLLLENGADINIKSEVTAHILTSNENIKKMISDTQNHTPQKLVEILSNFTIDKPIKYTTHIWDFDLKEEYDNFNNYMIEVKKQFNSFEKELYDNRKKTGLSENLHKKIKTFLLDENPDVNYSWSNKVHVNIGWSSLKGLQEWCDAGKDPYKFPIKEPILLDAITELTSFGEIIELFKQEIEVRRDFQNLSTIFENIKPNMGNGWNLETSKLERQFYTDVEYFTQALNKIFDGIRKHAQYKEIDVTASESEEGVIELKIIHIGSSSTLNAGDMLKEIENGDFLDIKEKLTNLCDWSVEGSHEGKHFRINYLKSNNIKDIVSLDYQPKGFTYILKFYKR